MSDQSAATAYFVSPALIPSSLSSVKKFNYGDFLVKDAAIKYLFNNRLCGTELSYWDSLACQEIDKYAHDKNKPILVFGTNCISSSFSLFKNSDYNLQSSLIKDRFCALLFVGLFGTEPLIQGEQSRLEPASRNLLESILDNGIISARCTSTHAYLSNEFPNKHDQILSSGCISAAPIVNLTKRNAKSTSFPRVLFSLTCRNGSDSAEAQDLQSIIRIFQPEQITLIITQNRISTEILGLINLFSINVVDASRLSIEQYYSLISQHDIHLGSRAHVHIPALSLGLKSILTGFESRHRYFQNHYGQANVPVGKLGVSIPHVLQSSQEVAADRLIHDSKQRLALRDILMQKVDVQATTYNISSYNQWPVRSKMCLQYIAGMRDVDMLTEIGAGTGFISGQAASLGLSYRGFDVIPLTPDIKKLDANTETIEPSSPGDCLVCLGLLEYLTDIPAFFKRTVSKFKHAIISYNALTATSRSSKVCESLAAEMRARNEWVDKGYTVTEFNEVLHNSNLVIVSCKPTKYDEQGRYYCEYIFELSKQS